MVAGIIADADHHAVVADAIRPLAIDICIEIVF
jgi:hypothetical protein